jgi:alpha-ribazole phosphatase
MKIFIVRHSETNYNTQKLCNADPAVDVHLTGKGIEQTKNLAELLRHADYEVVYISHLPRTRETADIINKLHSKEIIVDDRLGDNRTGFESKLVTDWFAALEASGDKWNSKFNDGESLTEAASRGQSFIDDLKTGSYKSVLIVTHRFMTQVIFGCIENKSLEEASEFNLLQGTYAEFEI